MMMKLRKEPRGADLIRLAAAVAAAVLALVLFETLMPAGDERKNTRKIPGYAEMLFDAGGVHTIDLQVEDWPSFVKNAPEEEYYACTAVIDGEAFYNVGLRAKGNNSKNLTEKYGLSRYSLKLEFDRFVKGASYHGLDKMSLDASFQDNSYLKTYLAYDMMEFMGVPAPLVSYVWLTVNGADWGLFLAVEEPEESFAVRNFGRDYGRLYKPDYRSLKDSNEDVALKYTGDDPADYRNIFENAKFSVTESDQRRLIESLRILSEEPAGEKLESVVNVDGALRYFAVQVFVMNWDSYIGRTGHNYFLYEEDGMLSILPWDYNLAFGTYALGMPEPVRDPDILINYPVDTPAEGSVMMNRPLYHNLMKQPEYFQKYYEYMDRLLSEYFESSRFETAIRRTADRIAAYVREDPTAFCSYEDHRLAVETLIRICLLRTQSIRGQLDGLYPSSLREQEIAEAAAAESLPGKTSKRKEGGIAGAGVPGVDASSVNFADLGDFEDLENAKAAQDEAMRSVTGQS